MKYVISKIFIIIMVTLPTVVPNLIEQLNYFAQQNQYTSQVVSRRIKTLNSDIMANIICTLWSCHQFSTI